MSFFRNRVTVIENKATESKGLSRARMPGKIRLLFSGTLAESTGVFQAIDLAKKLHSLNYSIHLTLVGYCAKAETLRKIHQEIKESAFIQLHGGNYLVPHPEVIKAIYASDFGMICYPPSRHTENAIPTKLYEYLAGRLPIILQNHGPWVELASRYQACIAIDFPTIDPQALLQQMLLPFYGSSPGEVSRLPQEKAGVTWESEGEKLLSVLDKIIA
jgi:glycosyltransferase involved in cell wall biosynthesis